MSPNTPEMPRKPEVDPKKVEAVFKILQEWATFAGNIDYDTARAAARKLPTMDPSRASISNIYNALTDERKERNQAGYEAVAKKLQAPPDKTGKQPE